MGHGLISVVAELMLFASVYSSQPPAGCGKNGTDSLFRRAGQRKVHQLARRKRRPSPVFRNLLATAHTSPYIEVKIPPEVIPESLFIRYVLAGEDFGGWVRPLSGVSSYRISTLHKGRPATRIKAILYAPGCAIQTLDVALSAHQNPEYLFHCDPVGTVPIQGSLTRPERLSGHEIKIQAKYVARWAQAFLTLDESLVTSIPVGDVAYPSTNGRFRLEIPDFSNDSPDRRAEIQIWLKDRNGEAVVAQLRPIDVQLVTGRLGGLKIQNEYPSEIRFALCAADPLLIRDKIGFARRPVVSDACAN